MHNSTDYQKRPRSLAVWAKFMVAALLLGGAILTLMQGYTVPGPAGEVFRNNVRHGIDATPLFYTEVESLAPDE